ncbi:hypothetical protein D3C79_688670 [compost metagenome]
MFLQQALGKSLGTEAGLADIDHHEHAAIGLVHADARAAFKAGTDPVTPLTVGVAHLPHLGQVLLKGHLGGVLDKVRQAIEHAQGQVAQVLGQQLRADHPTDPPTGHGMGLGQAVDGRAALGHARQAGRAEMLALKQQLAVDLIGDQPQVMFDAQVRQALPGGLGQAGAGGVVRAVEQQGARARGNQPSDIIGVDPKALLRAHRHRYHPGCAGAKHCLVGHVHGLGDDHLVARVEQALGHAIQRTLRPGQHHHFQRVDRLPAMSGVVSGNGTAQGFAAAHIGIMGMAGAQAVDGGIDNRLRGIEIRVANRQQDDVPALALQFDGTVVDVPGCSTVTGDTLGERGITHGRSP